MGQAAAIYLNLFLPDRSGIESLFNQEVLMHAYTVRYQLNGQPCTHTFELEQPELAQHQAALHLMVLHFGDGENSLLMPPADASPQEILAQAKVMGLTQIDVA
ncbi:hypothetical protein [Pseudomonas juntendi]|uniref:hypothetical protein n=1 Tax=Pseudomonas juntendi TaxID=2666183 RepID=UPI0031FBE9A7